MNLRRRMKKGPGLLQGLSWIAPRGRLTRTGHRFGMGLSDTERLRQRHELPQGGQTDQDVDDPRQGRALAEEGGDEKTDHLSTLARRTRVGGFIAPPSRPRPSLRNLA